MDGSGDFQSGGDNGNQRTITDTSATTFKKFYKVEIVKP
jgi:hypothetical protein